MTKQNKILSRKEAMSLIDFWIAIEVLSPSEFREIKHKTYDEGLKRSESMIINNDLPWITGDQKYHREGWAMFYEVKIGIMSSKKVTNLLLEIYGNDENDAIKQDKSCVMMDLILNSKGVPIGANDSKMEFFAISSFPWGVSKCMKKKLGELRDWIKVEEEVKDSIKNDLVGCLEFEKIKSIYETVKQQFELEEEVVEFKVYVERKYRKLQSYECTENGQRVTKYHPLDSGRYPRPSMLNSFYLEDMCHIRSILHKSEETENIRRYLSMIAGKERKSILTGRKINQAVVESILKPSSMPFGRWPSKFPLSFLQQSAVNASISDLSNGGIFAINGPPGTGKTTLLRDIVADVICTRASVLAEFTHPKDAFEKSGEVKTGKSGLRKLNADPNSEESKDFVDSAATYSISDKLKGFEILISSTNNGAIENITKELPPIRFYSKGIPRRAGPF